MIAETRVCQNCKQDFKIDPVDSAFYEKINVPSPTWCPWCRMVRRMAFWNERRFFYKKDIKCNKGILGCYDTRHKEIQPSQLAMFYYDGYSCHCSKIYAPLTAMLYVDYIEVHITLDTNDKTLPDWEYSYGFTDVYELYIHY